MMGPAALLLLTLASAADPALLAPGPDELYASFDRSEWLVVRAHAVESSLARLHNRFSELSMSTPARVPCEDPEMLSIVARSRVLGAALRDAAQGARAEEARLDRVFKARTVSALIDAKTERRHERLHARVADIARRYAELRAWHHAYLERWTKRCPSKVVLTDTVGMAGKAYCVKEECGAPVAVIGIGGGRICPQGAPADGSVVIVQDGQACYSVGECACVPEPVLPGAVLGP